MMQPPAGYSSTAVWANFVKWMLAYQEYNHVADEFPYWEAFRDGYSAGLAEQDV